MNYQEKLFNIQKQFQLKASKSEEEQVYHEMVIQVVEQLIQLEQRIEEIKLNIFTNKSFKQYENQWHHIIDELCEILELFGEQDFELIKRKRIYEEMDEVIADLEDWIEGVNEDCVPADQQLGYLEGWDIGVFF